MTETLTADWIASKLREHRIEQKELAKAMGIAPSGVTRLLQGERKLRPREVQTVLGFFSRWIREVPDTYDPRPPVKAATSVQDDARPADSGLVPIYTEFAQRAAGATPAEWREPPAQLKTAPRAFGLFVESDRDAPLLLTGDVVYIHPGRPARNGARVLVFADGELVGAGLLRRTNEGRQLDTVSGRRTLAARDRIYVIAAIETV